jgi:hypothetical protein
MLDYWVALARLVEVMRRTGHLENVPQYLSKSDEYVGTRASMEPGLCFCKGEPLNIILANSTAPNTFHRVVRMVRRQSQRRPQTF